MKKRYRKDLVKQITRRKNTITKIVSGIVIGDDIDFVGAIGSCVQARNAESSPDPDNQEDKVASKDSFRLLAIGNSFSDNAEKFMYPILDAFGVKEIVVANLYIGGCSIETHVNNAASNANAYTYRKNTTGVFQNTSGVSMAAGLADEDWQYITLQQASDYSGVESTYDGKIKALLSYAVDAVAHPDSVVTAWHMTWSYQQNSTHSAFVNYNNDQATMYNSIVACVKNNIDASCDFDCIIPSGTAIQNARTSYIGDTLTIDGYHLDELGEFMAGLCYVLRLTGWNVADINKDKLPQQIMPYYDMAIESVLNALKKPFAVTPSAYKTDPSAAIKRNDYRTISNVAYSNASETCKLDIYAPQDAANADVVIEFHGGGLTGGSKTDAGYVAIGKELASRGIGFVSVNYRYFPEAKSDEFFKDAADAVKYVKDHASEYGFKRIFVSGQSAGAYIATMLAFNTAYLQNVGIDVAEIDGWLIESGQPTTHFEILSRRGVSSSAEVVDEFAPMYYVKSSMSFRNMLLMSYTDDIAGRLKQNTELYNKLVELGMGDEVTFKVLYGQHVVGSNVAYRGRYFYSDIILDFLQK